MSFRRFCAAVMACTLLFSAAPAFAQKFSDGYEFLEAVRKEDGTTLNKMLNAPGVQIIDTKDKSTGEGALHIVVKREDSTYLRFLLQRDANPNLQDNRGNTPMMVATEGNFIDGINILIRYKADVNTANSSGETPLIRAVQRRNAELVRVLLDAGADPDQADLLAGMSARDYAAQDNRSPVIAKLLADAPKTARKELAGPKL